MLAVLKPIDTDICPSVIATTAKSGPKASTNTNTNSNTNTSTNTVVASQVSRKRRCFHDVYDCNDCDTERLTPPQLPIQTAALLVSDAPAIKSARIFQSDVSSYCYTAMNA
ncbi:hypothetical protein HK100_012548, partial [Physocladia obscura]